MHLGCGIIRMFIWEKRRGSFYIGAFLAAILLGCTCSLNAQLLNGSFDANSMVPTSWQIDPLGVPPEIRQSFNTTDPLELYPSNIEVNLPPIDGQYFLLLKSDKRSHPQANFSQISQKITVRAGQSITGAYFFSTGDYVPYDDTATIKLIPDPCSNPTNLTEILLAKKSVTDVGSYQTMLDWEIFIHDFNDVEAGTYILTLRVEDAIDNIYTSRFAVDDLKIISAPEPNDPNCHDTLIGDINGDCRVDFFDFALLANEWFNICEEPTWCNKSDIDNSTMVDFIDLTRMTTNWLIDCNADPNNTACTPPLPPQ